MAFSANMVAKLLYIFGEVCVVCSMILHDYVHMIAQCMRVSIHTCMRVWCAL